MRTTSRTRALQFLAAGMGLAAGSYAINAVIAWLRYGRTKRQPRTDEADSLLDRFMPDYEVVDRHHVRIDAPPDIAFSASAGMDLLQSRIIRGIFKARELALRGRPRPAVLPTGLIEQMQTLGWSVLAEVPGREIVLGAATRPWQADPEFRALPPEDFAAFNQPDFVKIVWNLRADSFGHAESIFRTETRATTTDAGARSKFRRYWSAVLPGIIVIRRIALRLVKRAAERRAKLAKREASNPLLSA